MPPEPPPKNVRRNERPRKPTPAPPPGRPIAPPRRQPVAAVGPPSLPHGAALAAPIPPSNPGTASSADVGISVATNAGSGGVVTARRAGGLRDMALEVDPDVVGLKAALQHLAKAVNIAFQTDYGE